MIIKRRCDSCGSPYAAQRASSKFCGTACRVRASRSGGVTPLSAAPLEQADEPAPADGTVAAVRAELEAVEQSSSALGAMALALAARIDSGRETGSAMATLTRELRLTLDEARASGRHASSIAEKLGDELAQRRVKRGARRRCRPA